MELGNAIGREEFFVEIAGIKMQLQKIIEAKPRFVSRAKIIKEIGIEKYEAGVRLNILHPLKGTAQNSKILVENAEYEAYIQFMKR